MKVVSWCAKVPMISPSLTNPQRLSLLSSTGAPEISFSVKSLRASSALAFSLTEKTSVCISEESTLASATLSSFCADCSFCKLMRKARKNPKTAIIKVKAKPICDPSVNASAESVPPAAK